MDDTIQKLVNEVINLGRDDKARAKALGVSPRTISDYKAGKFPRIVVSLLEQKIVVLQNTPIVSVASGTDRPKRRSVRAETGQSEGSAQLGLL
jgi:hypothetical protein